MQPPSAVEHADVLLVETTYGNRQHANESIAEGLTEILKYVIERPGWTAAIPSQGATVELD